jgi:hypothetical protein
MSPRNSAGQAAKPPRRKELGTIPLRLPAAGKRKGVYFNSISIVFLFISRSEAESISILFPLYFQFGTLYFVPGTSYNPRHQVRITN